MKERGKRQRDLDYERERERRRDRSYGGNDRIRDEEIYWERKIKPTKQWNSTNERKVIERI